MCGRKSHFSWEQNSLFEIIVIQNKISSVCLLISCRDGWEGGEPFLKCKWCISIRVECNYMSCIQVTTLQFYWSHRICRIVVELVLWQVINDLPVWQFANAHKGMRKNAGSENLSFCQNSTAIFRGRSPSFETERSPAFFERRTVLTICTQSYVESATSVFGKKAILISSFNNFKSTTLIHYTLNQNRLLKIDKFNVEFHR